MNVIHVRDDKANPVYSLVTTESDLRQRLLTRRNRSISAFGTVVVILGIFWQYLWQATISMTDLILGLLKKLGKRLWSIGLFIWQSFIYFKNLITKQMKKMREQIKKAARMMISKIGK